MDLTPQQQAFLASYLNPKSETWGNALQSAVKAGYSDEYAKVMISRDLDWLSDNVNDNKLITKALKNLEMALEGMLDDPEGGAKNIQWKATDTTLRTLKKDKFSERQELTGKDGERLIASKEEREVIDNAFNQI